MRWCLRASLRAHAKLFLSMLLLCRQIGHALGYFALATKSLNAAGFDPKVLSRCMC